MHGPPISRGAGLRLTVLDGTSLVEFRFDGRPVMAPRGTSIAAALIEHGRRASRTSLSGSPRGYYCGMGVCWECVVSVKGRGHVRGCMEPVAAGLEVLSLSGTDGLGE